MLGIVFTVSATWFHFAVLLLLFCGIGVFLGVQEIRNKLLKGKNRTL